MGWEEIKQARRWLSREQGTIIKDWGGRLPVALIYPNSYYVGMSSLGVHAIYSLLNSYPEVVCERVFWEKESQARKSPPISLESQRPLADFAVLAFSVSYEVDYLNVVQILKASGIPLYASERNVSHPLVIAGGPAITANPRPLSPFFDALCIGEAEPILLEMLPLLSEDIGEERNSLLKTLASMPGVYVPQYYSGASVARQWLKKLDDFPTASTVFTRDTELGNLCLIEVERGCGWGCPFCLVSSAFSPMRLRSVSSLIAQAERGLRFRKRIGLVGPAVTDHPQIEELVVRLYQRGAGLSISSLRIKPLSRAVLETLAKGGAKSISLAPEAGSQRLRQFVKKGISEDDILKAVSQVAELGIRQLKLYFMIGLPLETDDDINEVVRLAISSKYILDRKQSGTRLVLNVAPFVPKAGTTFERLPMAPLSTLNQRLRLLKKSLPPRGIRVKFESPAWSEVQAVLSRGDATVAEALANVEEVSLAGWRRAVAKCNLDIDFYAHQKWDVNQRLPWMVIDSGASEVR